MQVQMVDCLSTVRPGVHHRSIALAQVLGARDLSCEMEQVTEKKLVILRLAHLGERTDMLLWNYEYVDWRLGIDVPKGDRLFILEDLLRRNCAAYDLAKQTIHP